MQQRRALGKGISSLIPQVPTVTPAVVPAGGTEQPYPSSIPTSSISPNRHQPRQIFDEEKIRGLADSIREQGVIQPLIVSKLSGGRYELVAGERRLRAARMLGLNEVPVIVKDVDEEGFLALALIENVQREDLNPIEEARALSELIDKFEYSQDDVAKKVGKSRSYVANSLRLLKLPQLIQNDLAAGSYSPGHARALLALPNSHEQLKFREHILKSIPTVRDVELMVQNRTLGGPRRRKRIPAALSPQTAMLMGELVQSLGTKVRLKTRNNGSGQLIIDFYSAQDLDRIYRRIVA